MKASKIIIVDDSPLHQRIKKDMMLRIVKDAAALIKKVDDTRGGLEARSADFGEHAAILVSENVEYFQKLTSDAIDEYILKRLAKALSREIAE